MKMTKKKIALGVAIIVAAWALWSVLKPAPAEAAEVGFTLGAERKIEAETNAMYLDCLLYTSPSPRDKRQSRKPSYA